MLPLMGAIVSSVYLSHWMLPQSIYTLKLSGRGISFPYTEDTERAGRGQALVSRCTTVIPFLAC